jgi:hypothetical protein
MTPKDKEVTNNFANSKNKMGHVKQCRGALVKHT